MRFSTIFALVIAFCTATVFGQQPNGQSQNQEQTFTRNTSPMIPKVGDHSMIDSPMKGVFGFEPAVAGNSVERQTRIVNIGPAVAAYARLKKIGLQQARFDALQYFGAVENQPNSVLNRYKPRFKSVSADRFEVTAPVTYFENLPAMIRSFELGKKSIVVTIEYLDLDEVTKDEISKFLIKDTVQHVAGRVPDVPREIPESKKDEELYRASSTLQVSKSMPLTIGQMDFDSYGRLMKLVKSRSNCSITNSPTIVANPGQDAYVTDGSMQPFVVGVKQVDGDFAHANQPIIQLLEDGNFFRVNCSPVEDKIQLDCSFAFAEVVSDERLDIRKMEDGTQVSVQTPSHHVRNVNLCADLARDRVLVVDPYHVEISGVKTRGKTRIRKHHVVALIRAKIIDSQ